MSELTTDELSLYELILFYRENLEIAISFLNEKSKQEKNFHIKNKTGYLNAAKSVSYSFHGRGCTIITDNISISVDFDEDGRCDGFDEGYLWAFLNSNKELKKHYLKIDSLCKTKKLLEGLKNNGRLFCREFILLGLMYLLPEDFFSTTPLKWFQNV